MASRVWLLVEWVDESNVFPSYGVVNVDTRAYNETDLHLGNLIFLSVKHENPRRAKILRISENKRYVQEYKATLERQDQQVKNVLQLCMRTIKEMKSEHYNTQEHTTSHNTLAHVVVARDDDSSSDSDQDPSVHLDRSRIHTGTKINERHVTPYNGTSLLIPTQRTRAAHNSNNQRSRSMASSTPLPGSKAPGKITLFFDQGTQTEGLDLQPPIEKVEEMEAVLKSLYRKFNSLVAQANSLNGSTSVSESEQNDDSYVQPNNGEYWVDDNNVEYMDQNNGENIGSVVAEQVVTNHADEPMNLVNSSAKVDDKQNINTVRVRRMSAQTTNNIDPVSSNAVELVPIGNGNAKVPARLLNDIDWTSYTSATRQLLQALFSRRVLATHSLTGKQSPAFLNKPPKKILDPKLVEDIVKTVSTRCGVPKSLVRNSITIKCTDEAKLYRNRQQYKLARKSTHQNEENIPPSVPSLDELANAIN